MSLEIFIVVIRAMRKVWSFAGYTKMFVSQPRVCKSFLSSFLYRSEEREKEGSITSCCVGESSSYAGRLSE